MTRSAALEQPRSHPSRTPPRCFVEELRTSRRSVLLVDHEMEQLLPLADALRRAGMVTTIATSEEEALFYVRMSQPDVAVLDAEMADRSLLVGIRALVVKLPLVLMLRAPRHDPAIAAMLAIAGVTSVQKPVPAWRLLELVADARGVSTAVNVR